MQKFRIIATLEVSFGEDQYYPEWCKTPEQRIKLEESEKTAEALIEINGFDGWEIKYELID